MTPEVADWILRAVAVALVGAVVGLFARLRTVERGRAVADTRIQSLEGRPSDHPEVVKLHQMVHDLRLHLAEHYVRSDGYVAQMTGICTRIDGIGVMVARIDEWRRTQTPAKGADE